MVALKNVGINDFYEYFFCPCTLTKDLIDAIRNLDPDAKLYDHNDINQHKTGVKHLDDLTAADKEDISDFYMASGMSEEEAGPDNLDAIFTKLDSFDLCDASKQLFGKGKSID